MSIYVGNLSYRLDEEELRSAFEAFGEVVSVKIVMDRETGRSRGFGFVEMADEENTDSAIEALNGQDLAGRPLVVNKARPKERRPRSF